MYYLDPKIFDPSSLAPSPNSSALAKPYNSLFRTNTLGDLFCDRPAVTDVKRDERTFVFRL